jgi:hypothetical protein
MDTSLVFGIIFASIVMGLLVFFGFRYISDMMSLGCESQTAQQMESLKSAVKSTLALSKGSVQEFKIIIQSTCASKICFVDSQNPDVENRDGGWIPSEQSTYIVTRNGYNVLVYGNGDVMAGHAIDKFKPYVNFCVTSSRDVMLRNNGKTVEITLPEFG